MSQALSNLAVGSKVKFGSYSVNGETAQPIIWTIVAKNHPGYPDNSVTLHTSKIIDLRCFDAAEAGGYSDRMKYGNNRYSISNIDQWLNKDADGGSWYVAAHSVDHSPDTTAGTGNYNTQYANRPGFLNSFTDNEKAAILSTTIRVVKPNADGGSYEDVVRKVFLPSTTEVGLSNEHSIAEGKAWGYYTNNTARNGYITEQCSDHTIASSRPATTLAWYWWLRTPYYSSLYQSRIVSSTGVLSTNNAYNGSIGIRPVLNLSNTLKVSDFSDGDDCYIFLWQSAATSISYVGGTETYTENIQVQRAVGMQDNSSTLTEDRQDEFWEDKYYYEGSSTANSDGFHLQFSNNDIEGMCFLSRHFTTDKVGTTITSKITFLKAFNNVEISKIDWRNGTSGVDTTTETCTIKLNDTSVYTISATKEQYGTYTASIATGILIGDVSAGDIISFVDNKSGTISSTSAYRDLVGGLRFYFSSDPSVFTETVQVQKTRGINKPVSSIYAGVTATVPVYTETTTTEDIALSSTTFTDFFSASNTGTTGTNAKGITWTDNSGGGLKLKFGNYGINSSTSMTTFTAQRDLTNVVIKGLYYTESRFDKITLTVAGTTVLNAVSGTSSTLTQRWTGSLSKGQTIVLKFVKDSSQSASNEKSTYFTLSCDPYQKTVTTKIQTGTETKLVDKKIVKGYVGGPDGKARLFFGENTPSVSYSGTFSVRNITNNNKNYQLYTLTTTGLLTITKEISCWLCGGGGGGTAGYEFFNSSSDRYTTGQSGCGGGGGYTLTTTLAKGTYAITIGAGGKTVTHKINASSTPSPTGGDTIIKNSTTNTLIVAKGGGDATANGEKSANGGSGGGYGWEFDGTFYLKYPNGQSYNGGNGAGVSTYPFGITSLEAHCAGGAGADVRVYGEDMSYYKGGLGGSNGSDGGNGESSRYPTGGVKGGGSGGGEYASSYGGSDATFYGSGGGGGCGLAGSSSASGGGYAAGKGYQGVVYLLIPA